MTTPRARKEKFIASSDRRSVDAAIRDVLHLNGLDAFHDFIVDEIVAELIEARRLRNKVNAENRVISVARDIAADRAEYREGMRA